MSNRYLFIDGAYLRETITYFEREIYQRTVPVDYSRLSQGFRKTFYYDCLPAKKTAKAGEDQAPLDVEHDRATKAQVRLFEHLQSIAGWHVVEGIAKPRRDRGVEQKEVDVLIAVDMLGHTHRRNMESAAFVAGDVDFRPLVEAIVRDGMYLTLYYEPRHASAELVKAADEREPISPRLFHDWLTAQFQAANPLPVYGGVRRTNDLGAISEVDAWKSGEIDVRLFVNGATYYIVRTVPPSVAGSYASPLFQLQHTDRDLLRRVHDVWFKPDDLRAANPAS